MAPNEKEDHEKYEYSYVDDGKGGKKRVKKLRVTTTQSKKMLTSVRTNKFNVSWLILM